MIQGVLLAAGAATRFGSNKLLHPLADGTPIVVAAARRLLKVLPNSLAVVKSGDVSVRELLKAVGMRTISCLRVERGMGASLACGVAASADASGWLIALADMPWIQEDTLRGIVALLEKDALLAAPFYQNQRGHPVGFSAALRTRLLALDNDQGGRAVIAQYQNRLERLCVADPAVVADVDTCEDLESQ